MVAIWYANSMVAKVVYAKKGDKKLMKQLAKEMKPALISLAAK
jgi:hypothetical protein